ncbi:hypothetical protein A6R68_19911, partial [Neotoma lepida]
NGSRDQAISRFIKREVGVPFAGVGSDSPGVHSIYHFIKLVKCVGPTQPENAARLTENKRPIMYERMIRKLVLLIKQHGSLLKRHMRQMTGPLRLCSEDTALETETGDLVPSNALRYVCCGKPGPNLEDPRRFTPSAGVLNSFHVSLVCQESDVGKGKEWTPGICKQQLSRRNPATTWWKIPEDSPPRPLSWTAHISPWSARKLMRKKGKSGLRVF